MALWQFTVIAALIGALLVSVAVLVSRVGNTNSMLKRIEEALRAPDRIKEPTPAVAATDRTAAAEATAATVSATTVESTAPVEQPPAVSGKEGDTGYLTIRDLKVMEVNLRAASAGSQDSVPSVPESREAINTSGELPIAATIAPVDEYFVAATLESVEAPAVIGEPQSAAPDNCAIAEDDVERKNREALLLMNSQRRRRRARAGR